MLSRPRSGERISFWAVKVLAALYAASLCLGLGLLASGHGSRRAGYILLGIGVGGMLVCRLAYSHIRSLAAALDRRPE